ncbi:hypothetical protein G6F46_011767 [Rhizopus delemar]|nr:hypothetical protein G6F54_011482 [Rhizopus delemar]KAG1513713.1 hypothetical protein G6F52_010096 [Rhizopus delemar]KAG1540865.1 hypothetical protein G6F49_012023 [Rhizopus delemar]KAG1608144.1 hypothetical protein G6F46_011767 [Rhizopus delemar]
MLIGYWESIPSNNPYISTKTVAQIKSISFLTRSDKRKDRVEIAPENLHLAAIQAEELGKKMNRPMMVIGWYHSHPHITVFPSHIDVRTQLSQQLMDDRFFGLIVSCFDTASDNSEKIQITCFQSKKEIPEKLSVPLLIQPESRIPEDIRELYLHLPGHIYEEYKKEYKMSTERIHYDLRTKQSDLPNKITQSYNAMVYGQLVTNLMDNIILPATHLLESKSIALDKEIKELQQYKDQLLSNLDIKDTNNKDSIHLYNKIRIGFFDTNHLKSIDMDKPIASFITLPEKDSLFEYQSPQGPFSDLLDIGPVNANELDQDPCSVLNRNSSPSLINLSELESFNPDLLYLNPIQDITRQQTEEPFMMEGVNFDIDIDTTYDPNILIDSYPNLLNAASVPRAVSDNLSQHSFSSSTTSTFTRRLSGSGETPYSATGQVPSLIPEEDERHSVATDVLDVLVPETETIVESSPRGTGKRRRIQRMVVANVQATMLTTSDYTAENIVTSHAAVEESRPTKRERRNHWRDLIRTPTLSITTPSMSTEQGRSGHLFNPKRRHVVSNPRWIERPRRGVSNSTSASLGSYPPSIIGGSTIRSTSDLTTPELQLLDFGEANE